MNREILINITPMETRVALVDNGVPQEISIERNQRSGLVGNIYKGKVVRVLPGMQAAFVDIGVERAGFLHVRENQRISKFRTFSTMAKKYWCRSSRILLTAKVLDLQHSFRLLRAISCIWTVASI
jgi:Rne/Rng family ribonuclease